MKEFIKYMGQIKLRSSPLDKRFWWYYKIIFHFDPINITESKIPESRKCSRDSWEQSYMQNFIQISVSTSFNTIFLPKKHKTDSIFIVLYFPRFRLPLNMTIYSQFTVNISIQAREVFRTL